MEVTVSGLPSYVTDVSQFSEDQIDSFAEKYLKQVRANKKGDWLFAYSNIKPYKTWFLNLKPNRDFKTIYNKIVICVSYDSYLRDEYHSTSYVFYEFENIIADANGVVDLKYEDGKPSSTFTENIDDTVTNWSYDYIVTELK